MKNSTKYFFLIGLFITIFLVNNSLTQAQPLNNWLEFDGTNDYVDLGNSNELKPTSGLTVEVWAYNSNWSTFTDGRFISNTQSGGYYIGGDVDKVKAYVMLNGAYYVPSIALSSLNTGWHHFALTCDGRYAKLYVDGVLEDTKDAGATYPIEYNTSNNTFLAAEAGGGATPVSSYFDGTLDDIRIWNVARTQTEIQDNLNAHLNGNEAGLAGYWKLNETSGTIANDETANGNNGTLVNMSGDEWMAIFSSVSNSLDDVGYSSVDWGDYDNDGDLDILLTGYGNGSSTSEIYKNNGDGTFTKQTGISLTGVDSGSAAWGDYDNDLDILLTGYSSPAYTSKIYKNNGDGTFTEQTGISLTGVKNSSVAWGDYNNDGYLDILLTGQDNSLNKISKIYKNNGSEGSGFTEQTSISLTGVKNSSVAWGDYNNDGFLDILLTGQDNSSNKISKIYKNNGDGTFTEQSGISLSGVTDASVSWGDYDNDGDLDILLTGFDGSNGVSKIYKNNGDGTFTEQTGISLTGVRLGSVAWGDYDNDGDLDILLTGYSSSANTSKIYKNNGDGTFTEQTGISLTGVNSGSVAWGDYDNDGDLDILLTGTGSAYTSKIYENNSAVNNTVPNAPTNLSASVDDYNVTLSWNAASDNETPSAGLSYNVYVGTSPGSVDVNSPMANIASGFRRVVRLGNAHQNTTWQIKGLQGGSQYYWSVQSIDHAFAGSAFANEGTFTTLSIPDSVPGNSLDFDGTDDYVNIPDNNSLNNNSFTIELWLKPGSLRIQHLVTKQDPGGGGRYWRIFMASANGSIEFDAIPGEIANCNTGNIAQVGEWIHIAAVYDHAASTVKLYADGVLKSEVTSITDMGGATDEGLTFSKSYSPLDGCLDEVRYWNIALTEEQIRENMYLPLSNTETGLVSYWQFNDGSGTTLTDNLNTNDGTLNNMTDDDWISSSIPFGPGFADTETEANGTVNFNNTGLSMYFNLQNGAEITVTRIDTTANVNPSEPETVFDEQYWVVNRYGTGSFNTDITFTISEDLTAQDESYPTNIKLYTRDSNADTNWEYLADAISVNAANNTAAFSGISSFSQFLISRDKNPQITLYEPFNFDLVTNNFNSIDVWDYATPAFTDFDGDGLLDMIVGQIDGNLNYYEQDAENSTSFTLVTNNFNSIDVINAAPTFTDLDGDGLLDLMVGENYGQLYHYEQDSENSTSFTLVTNNFNSIDVGNKCKPTFADIDGDGLLDLIVGEAYGQLYHYEQDSENGTSFTLVTNNFNSIDVGGWSAPTFTDLDGDGILDMIVGESNGNLYYYKQDAENSTSFSLVTENFNSIDVWRSSAPTFTDLDGEGLLDLIVGSQDGTLSYYEQHGIDTLDFAKRLIGFNAVKSYYLKASELINDLDINCSGTEFSISQSENSGYSQNLTIPPANGIVFDIIFVKFSPTQENSYAGNIEHTSNGAQTQSIVLSGTGCSIDNFPGNALDFDGIDDYVNIGNDHSLNVENTLTIEAWVKPDSLTNQYGIFSTGIDNRAGSFQLEVGPGNGGTNRVAVTSPGTWVAQTGDNAIIPNKWNHIVYTRSGTGSGTHKIYVNGEEQTLISDADYSFADNTDDKVIASATNGVQLFTGKIDEVRLWNIVRTESEIRENMYFPLSGLESGLVSYWQFNEGSETSASDLISGNYGTLTNMTVDDWISSSIPFGPGYTDTETETNGTVAFSNTGLSMNFSSQNGAEITVTRIDTIPNINPDISGTVFDSQYWVVNRYGNGSFDADLTFTISEDLTAEYESYPAYIKLYTRDSNADTNWEYLADATSVNAANNTATFTSITSFSQFIIVRDNPQITLVNPSDFDLVTNNFDSIDVGSWCAPTFTDLDGDRLLDMIVGEENGNLNYYEQDAENSTSFTLVTNNFNSINVGGLSAPAFTDLDGDGLLDMIVGGDSSNLHHYEQDAENSTSFTLVTNNFSSLSLVGNSKPTFTDIDGDGLLDMIVGKWDPGMYHYEQDAENSTSFTLVTNNFNSINAGYNETPTFTDIDGDGLLDLIVGDDYGHLHHYEQDSENSSSFSLVTDYLNSIDEVGSTAPAFTDLLGDGLLDLIVGNSTGKLSYYEQQRIDSLSFGNQSIGHNTVQSYSLKASDLINDLNINCSSTCFSVSLTENSGYSQSLSITPVNGRVTEKIFVRFSPTQEITYTENIEHTSNRAQTQSIVLSGTGYRIDSFPGTALEFDGTEDFVNIGTGSSLNTGNTLTIEAWIKPTDLSTRQGIYSTRKNNPSGSFQLEVGPGNGGTNRVAVAGINTWVAQTNDNAITLNEWNHIVYTRSGTGAGTHKIYVNGEEQNLISDADYTFIDNSDDKVVASGMSGGNLYQGKIDEVRLWNTARTKQEIRENKHLLLAGTENGLVSYWQFNETSGATANDFISGNNGTLTNMDDSDWITSTIPFGDGISNSQTETAGTVDFTNTSLSMYFNSQNGAEITVTRIDTTANIVPTDPDEVFDEQYWVVNRFGSGTFYADLTFTLSEDLTIADENNPANISLYTRGSTADTAWALLTSASSVNAINNTATFEGITGFSQFIIAREVDLGIELNLSAFLEGPFNGTDMTGHPEPVEGWPMEQPYNISPWNYSGIETLTEIPEDMVDWVLIELRDASDSSSATPATQIAMQAAILISDGSIKTLDGTGNPMFESISVNQNLYAIIWHRNHLPILSANAVESDGGIYTYDFTIAAEQAYGDNQADLGNGYFGMFAADMNADGIINNDDLLLWKQQAGQKGYLMEDANLDGEVENKDKNDLWHQNQNKEQMLPE